MSRIILIISTLFVAAYASGGQLSILHHSKGLDFKGNDKLESESVGDVFAASLGYSVEHPSNWAGLYVSDPFNTVNGAVVVLVDGIERVHVNDKAITYEVVGSGAQESFDSLLDRVRPAVDLDLTQGIDSLSESILAGEKIVSSTDKSVSSLKPQSYPEDKLFLEQLAAIGALSKALQTIDELPAFLSVRLSVAALISAHNESPAAVAEAMKLLSATIEQLNAAAQKRYDGNVLVAVVAATEDPIVRSKRDVSGRTTDPIDDRDALNLAGFYNDSYPVMFNIILWFGVIMAFSLFAISYTIGYMDPGRDSIIYRMTSTRMKKDN